ncbi:ankyrin repeat domain-containing protein 27 [Phlebotomus papatasi]|uniref:ankyrin repeat domain-containing protein 27 n=1 Tax=Phlebotomus papatasi TaxID=29031 RepID=UPI0024846B15|nr:ankyrin repeat domain-containing protein 27 [Phlebotomus papatasi]
MAYHPCPESDYTDSDSEFDFAFPKATVPREIPSKSAKEIFLETLENALRDGDLETVKKCFEDEEQSFGVDEAFPRSNWTPLFWACHVGSLPCVQFLVETLGADVHLMGESMRPLLMACNSENRDQEAVLKIVELLMEKGASAAVSDRYGFTPLMYACQRGHLSVVLKLLQITDPEIIDSSGRTALFHAIEWKQKEVVIALLEHGVCKDIVDFKGFTPKRLAEFCGHTEILDLIPRSRIAIDIPTNFLTYSKLEDVVPGLVGDSKVPAYFPDLKTILFGMDCDQLLPIFALRSVSLEDFLSADEVQLKEWGIKLPFQRKKILRGIFLFHMREWKTTSVPQFKKEDKIDMLDLFRISASNLKHLVVLKATQRHIKNAMEMKLQAPDAQTVARCRYAIHQLIEAVSILKDRITYIQSFNPKPILNIDHEALRRKRIKERWRKYLVYSVPVVAVITVFVIRKVRVH